MPLLTANGAFELGKKPPEFAQAVLPTSVISILKKISILILIPLFDCDSYFNS